MPTPTNAHQRGGSLRILMDELEAVANSINASLAADKLADLVADDVPDLAVYRWRPLAIDPPALYHVLSVSPFTQQDQVRWRDTLVIGARIALPYGVDGYADSLIEVYSDAYRNVIDPAILGSADNAMRPFNGAAHQAARTDMRPAVDEFGGVEHACIEFAIQCQLDRKINPVPGGP